MIGRLVERTACVDDRVHRARGLWKGRKVVRVGGIGRLLDLGEAMVGSETDDVSASSEKRVLDDETISHRRRSAMTAGLAAFILPQIHQAAKIVTRNETARTELLMIFDFVSAVVSSNTTPR